MNPKFRFALREDLKDKKEFLPTRGEPKATGWDVRAALSPGQESLVIKPFDYIKISLGFRALCPDGWWLELRPRSSSFTKKNLHALYGVIDETYEGDMIFAAQYLVPVGNIFSVNEPTLTIAHGDAIGQIIPVKRQEMEVIEATNEELGEDFRNRAASRGAGGFGSTGK